MYGSQSLVWLSLTLLQYSGAQTVLPAANTDVQASLCIYVTLTYLSSQHPDGTHQHTAYIQCLGSHRTAATLQQCHRYKQLL